MVSHAHQNPHTHTKTTGLCRISKPPNQSHQNASGRACALRLDWFERVTRHERRVSTRSPKPSPNPKSLLKAYSKPINGHISPSLAPTLFSLALPIAFQQPIPFPLPVPSTRYVLFYYPLYRGSVCSLCLLLFCVVVFGSLGLSGAVCGSW